MEQSIDKTISIIEFFINEGDLLKAKKLLLKFKSTPYIKDRLLKLTFKMQKMNQLQTYYSENNFQECYDLIDLNHFLTETKLGKLLNNYWMKIIKDAENIALTGNIQETIRQLENILEIKTRKHKIGSILRLCSFSKIKIFLGKKDYGTRRDAKEKS